MAAAGGAGALPVEEKKQDRSRDNAAQGKETLAYFSKLNVLIVGLKGLGTEIAKNIILTGPAVVTVCDPELAVPGDLGLNYYLKPANVGSPRGPATAAALQELNDFVKVSSVDALTEEVVAAHNVAIFTGITPLKDLIRWNEFCRARNIAFLAGDVRGAAGYFFNDFGAEPHTIKDRNGENLKQAVVFTIEPVAGNDSVLQVLTDASQGRMHGFSDGDWVLFKEVEGMEALNDGKPRRITNSAAFGFRVELLEGESAATFASTPYTKGGIVSQTHVPFTTTFASLADRLSYPVPADNFEGLITPDFAKFGRPAQLLVAFQALYAFAEAHGGAAPALRDAGHAAEVVALAKGIDAKLKALPASRVVGKKADGSDITESVLALDGDLDEALVARIASLAACELPGLSTFFSGVIAQEVVKLAGKFTPLRQWLLYDCLEVLHASDAEAALLAADAAEFVPRGDRYDNMVGLVGRSLATKLSNQKVFLVGCGALGCEMLKNFVLMGVGCGPDGLVTATDMDTIELSNLSRQFLYRRRHVGAFKSATSTAEIASMNADFKTATLTTPVGPTTEDVFTDSFWAGQDIVVNALDNVEARKYMDAKCVFFSRPMLDSGTLGTKANTFVVVPRLTETYRDSNDGADDGDAIPMCTIREMPYLPDHCIEWARSVFQGEFSESVRGATMLQGDAAAWLASQREALEKTPFPDALQQVIYALQTAKSATFETIVGYGIGLFTRYFTHKIQSVVHFFPESYVSGDGSPYWVGRRRFPTVVKFDFANPLHKAFLLHTTALAAQVFGVTLPADWDSDATLGAVVAKTPIPEWSPPTDVAETGISSEGASSGAGDKPAEGGERALAEKLLATIEKDVIPSLGGVEGLKALKFNPLHFEKDDDSNHHVDFMTAAANLRATNFRIPLSDRDSVRITAGRIIPAIATTTTMITGLVSIELMKVAAAKAVDSMRAAFINLGTNVYAITEPAGPKRSRSKTIVDKATKATTVKTFLPDGFTEWDYVEITNPAVTPDQIAEILAAAPYGVKLVRLFYEYVNAETKEHVKTALYSALDKKRKAERGAKAVTALIPEVCGAEQAIPAHRHYLVISAMVTKEGSDETDVPPVRIKLTSA